MFVENLNSFDLQSCQNKSLSSHSFDKCSLECSSRNSDSHTNSHYVISQCDDLICFSNDRIRDLQTYTCSRKSFASILDSDSLLDFSILEGLFNSLQFSSIVKSILSSVGLTVESYQMPRELRTNEDLYFERALTWRSHKSYLFSNPPTSRSSRPCFVFYLCPFHDHSFEGASDCYLWGSLACFIVLPIPHPINILSRLTLRKSLVWRSEKFVVLLICREWLFFFVVTRLDLARNSSTPYHSATSLSHDKYERGEEK